MRTCELCQIWKENDLMKVIIVFIFGKIATEKQKYLKWVDMFRNRVNTNFYQLWLFLMAMLWKLGNVWQHSTKGNIPKSICSSSNSSSNSFWAHDRQSVSYIVASYRANLFKATPTHTHATQKKFSSLYVLAQQKRPSYHQRLAKNKTTIWDAQMNQQNCSSYSAV